MICPYCKNEAEFVTGERVYPNRKDLYNKNFYICEPCDARVGCHADGEPYGTLANAELRKWRSIAHAEFDPMWQDGYRTRTEAYKWLSDTLGIPKEHCHIGMFDIQTCRKILIETEKEIKR